jgi:predicted nucleotidyltransferase
MDAEAAIASVVATIKDGYRPERIILFGSRIWGDPRADSDLDVLVIKDSLEAEAERIRQVSRLVRPRPLPLDILVKTPTEVRERLAAGDHFLADILRRGRVAYERDAF